MKIRTRLLLSAGASIALAVALGLVVLFTNHQVSEGATKAEVGERITVRLSELNSVTSDYMVYGGERARTQWYTIYESLVALVATDEFVAGLQRDFERIDAAFAQLVAVRESQTADGADIAAASALEDRLMAQLSLLTQSMTSDAAQLADAGHGDQSAARRRATILILAFGGALLAVVAGTSLFISASIANPIARLTRVAEGITQGDLDARVEATRKDELGVLGRAFDTMTERVKETIGSLEERVAERTHELTEGNKELEREVAQRKRAGEALRLQNAALEAAANAIVIANREGHITWVNPAFTRLTGYGPEEALGQNPRILKSGEQDELFYKDLWHTILSGQVWRGEIINRRKDGSLYTEEQTITPVPDERGEISYFIAIKQDITERKRAEEELRALNESLEQRVAERTHALARQAEELARSNAELEQFAYIASHDLQEPLRMVTSYTQLLAQRYEGKLDSDADDFIAYAVDGAKRMQGLIVDLLAYSRVVRKGREFQPADSETVVQHALANLKVLIEESGAVVTHDSLPTLTADPVQLGQVFQNVIENAIKFRGEVPPRVHVSAEQQGDDWVFSVRDNGIGIDPQYAGRIFVIFQRLHSKEEYPGTGIGLTICKRIIERHGGRIWVESKPGQGSTFSFAIPVSASGTEQIQDSKAA